MLYGPFVGGALLWLLVSIIWHDHDLDWWLCVWWAIAGAAVGWGGQLALQFLISTPDHDFPANHAEFAFSMALHILLSMGVVCGLIWRYYGHLPFNKILKLFISYAGIRVIFTVLVMPS
jgi:hypothetical protein